ALEPVDVLAERREQERHPAAGARRLQQRETALAAPDREDALGTPPLVHEGNYHLDAAGGARGIMRRERLEEIVDRRRPATQETASETLRTQGQRVRQHARRARLAGEAQEIVDGAARRRVRGGHEAADAAADHRVQRKAKLLEARENADVRG